MSDFRVVGVPLSVVCRSSAIARKLQMCVEKGVSECIGRYVWRGQTAQLHRVLVRYQELYWQSLVPGKKGRGVV
jgi:hypothetical protein